MIICTSTMRRMSLATFSRSSSHKSAIRASIILRSAVSIVALTRTGCRSSFHRDGGIGADALGFALLLVLCAAALLRTTLPEDETVWPELTGAPPLALACRGPPPPALPASAASRRPARRRHSCCCCSISRLRSAAAQGSLQTMWPTWILPGKSAFDWPNNI